MSNPRRPSENPSVKSDLGAHPTQYRFCLWVDYSTIPKCLWVDNKGEKAHAQTHQSHYSCVMLLPFVKLTRQSSAEMASDGWKRSGWRGASRWGRLTPTHIHLLLHLVCFQAAFLSKIPFISKWQGSGSEALECWVIHFAFIFLTCGWAESWTA